MSVKIEGNIAFYKDVPYGMEPNFSLYDLNEDGSRNFLITLVPVAELSYDPDNDLNLIIKNLCERHDQLINKVGGENKQYGQDSVLGKFLDKLTTLAKKLEILV